MTMPAPKSVLMFVGSVFLAMLAIDLLERFTGIPSQIRAAVGSVGAAPAPAVVPAGATVLV